MALSAIHPSEQLAQQPAAFGMCAAELGSPFQVPPNRITRTLKGPCVITGGTAAPEAFSGTSSHFWVKLQALYELRTAERNTGNAIKTLPTLAVHGRNLYDAKP